MPCSCKSSPCNSPSFDTRSVPVALTASITAIATANVAPRDDRAADHLGNQHLSAAAVEKSRELGRKIRRDVELAAAAEYLPLANKPSDNVPQMPQNPCTGTAPIGSSIRSHSEQFDAEHHEHSGNGTRITAPVGLTQ